MKLLPPKPPMSAGTEKNSKKVSKKGSAAGGVLQDSSAKYKKAEQNNSSVSSSDDMNMTLNASGSVDAVGSTKEKKYSKKMDIDAALNSLAQDKNDGTEDVAVMHEESSDLSQDDVPSISSIDETIKETDVSSQNTKKKGFFARLFGKKEDSIQTQDSFAQMQNVSQDANEQSWTSDTSGTGIGAGITQENYASSKNLENIADAEISNSNLKNIELQDGEIAELPDEKSWEQESVDDEISIAREKAKNYLSNYKSEYKKDKLKADYTLYDSPDSSKNKKAENKTAKSTEKSSVEITDWGEDIDKSAIEEKISSVATSSAKEVSKANDKLKSKSAKKTKGKEVEKETEVESSFSEEVKDLPAFNIEKAKSTVDFTAPVNEFKEQTTNVAVSGTSAKQVNPKLKKLLKTYELKISKMVSQEKKNISAELAKVNKRIVELQKKEKTLSVKEQKLLNLDKSLSKQRNEFDDLVKTENILMESKDRLEEEIAEQKKEFAETKDALLKLKKEFTDEKKAITSERTRLRDEFKSFKANVDEEKKKGEKKLSDLAKQVEREQAELSSTMEKNKKALAQLKNEEMILHEKEKEVTELIEEEKRILAVLKGSTSPTQSTEPHQRKKKSEKPATIIGDDGEPRLYVDDEDVLSQKIQDCKDLLGEGNIEDAKLLYNEIREELMTLQVADSKKKELRHQVRELYDEICTEIVAPRK